MSDLLSVLCRVLSTHSPNSPQPEVKPPGSLRAYIVRKYVDYITRFDATFERSYPKIYKVYRLFKDGIILALFYAKFLSFMMLHA